LLADEGYIIRRYPMQEIWEFDIPSGAGQHEDGWLRDLIDAKSKEVGIYLSYYYRPEGGLVEQVRVKEEAAFRDSTTGSLKVEFDVVYFNACLNINSEDNKDEMTLHFEINSEKQKVKFSGPYWPQREPDGL